MSAMMNYVGHDNGRHDTRIIWDNSGMLFLLYIWIIIVIHMMIVHDAYIIDMCNNTCIDLSSVKSVKSWYLIGEEYMIFSLEHSPTRQAFLKANDFEYNIDS